MMAQRLAGLAVLLLAGMPPAAAQSARFEAFFTGRSYANGTLSAINGERRDFFISLDGRLAGGVLTLRESFVFSNGEREVKTWRFRKSGPDSYVGTREDVIGETTLIVDGNRASMTYDINLTPKAAPTIVRFEDSLVLESDGSLRNTARMSKFGLPVGRVIVNFARSKAAAAALKP
jgi:uncharacterized SAM-binding protein YcdF (DUF218 family)